MARDDATTPDVVDAESIVSMPRGEAMESLGIDHATYERMMRDVEPVVALRANREAQRGERIPVVIGRPGRGRRIFTIPPIR